MKLLTHAIYYLVIINDGRIFLVRKLFAIKGIFLTDNCWSWYKELGLEDEEKRCKDNKEKVKKKKEKWKKTIPL